MSLGIYNENYETDFATLLQLLRINFPTIDSYAESEWIIYETKDQEAGSDPRKLVEHSIPFVLSELAEYGLNFYASNEELFDSLFNLNYFIQLKLAIQPKSIFTYLSNYKPFKDQLVNILNTIDTGELIIHYLDILRQLFNDNIIYKNLYTFFFDKVSSTETFRKYLEKVLETHETRSELPSDIDVDGILQKQQTIQYLTTFLKAKLKSALTDYLSNTSTTYDLKKLNNYVDKYYSSVTLSNWPNEILTIVELLTKGQLTQDSFFKVYENKLDWIKNQLTQILHSNFWYKDYWDYLGIQEPPNELQLIINLNKKLDPILQVYSWIKSKEEEKV